MRADRLAGLTSASHTGLRRRRTYPRLGQVRTAARPLFSPSLTREAHGPADACVMQGHGRTDRETPVHLAYRIRQGNWTDLGNLTVGPGGYDAGDRRTLWLFWGGDERWTAFDVLQAGFSSCIRLVDWMR